MTAVSSGDWLGSENLEGVVRALIDHAGLCVKVLDLNGRVLEWGPTCEALYGWTRDEALGRVLPHTPPENRTGVLAAIRMAAEGDGPIERNEVVRTSEGWLMSMTVTLVPLHDADGHVDAVLTVDRQLLLADEVDSMSQQMAAHLRKALSEPVGAIANASTLLSRPEVFGDPAQRNRMLATLRDTTRRLCAVIDQLTTPLAAEQVKAGGRVLTDVGAVLADVAAVHESGSGEVLVDFEPGSATALVDRTALLRALRVLLHCAVVSRDTGAVHATARPSGGGVVVQVSYVGAGPAGKTSATHAVPRNNEVVRDAWAALRYSRNVADMHGGDLDIIKGTNGDVTLQLNLPPAGSVG